MSRIEITAGDSGPEIAHGNVPRKRRRVRDAAIVAGLTGALLVGTAGVAQAQEPVQLKPGESQTYSTYFWGRTQFCFSNLNANNTGWVRLTSAFSLYDVTVAPLTQRCVAHSWVGTGVTVTNNSYNGAEFRVTLPMGP